MSIKQNDWLDDCKRFVGFFDIMGFKNMLSRDGHASVKDKMDIMNKIILTIQEKTPVLPVFFSDSVLLVSKDDSENAAQKIIKASTWLICKALENKIPMRGSIAYGLQTADFKKSIHFGQSLIDAFFLQEELHFYGGILHHTFEAFLKNINIIEEGIAPNITLKHCFTPLKSGNTKHYYLDWTKALINKDKFSVVSDLYNTASGSKRIYVDNTIKILEHY